MKFRKKPVVIEAFRYGVTEKHPDWWVKACEEGTVCPDESRGDNTFPAAMIKTFGGVMIVSPGDWVIRGVKGELYPCKPDIFEATYDEVE